MFFHKNLNFFFNKKGLWYSKPDHNFFLANVIVKLIVPPFQKTLTFNHFTIKYGRICFLKFDNAVSLLQKKIDLFQCFLTQNKCLPWKCQATVTNKLYHSRGEIKTVFWAWVWGIIKFYSLGWNFYNAEAHKSRWTCGQAHKQLYYPNSYNHKVSMSALLIYIYKKIWA